MAKEQKKGRCIFCSEVGLTKQHVIPDWISRLIPPVKIDQGLTRFEMMFDHAKKRVQIRPLAPEIKKYNGNFGQFKVRNVCRKCNGGWISQLEQSLIPVIEPLILGQDIDISTEDAERLALGLAVIAIVSETTDPNISRRVIPSEHLHYIFKYRKLPLDWRVGLGAMASDGEPMSRIHSMKAVLPGAVHPAIFVATIRLGFMVFQAVVRYSWHYPFDYKPDVMHELWPNGGSITHWKTGIRGLRDTEFDALANELFDQMRVPFSTTNWIGAAG